MGNNQNWIAECINEARILHPSVTEAVSDRMLALLGDRFTNRQLSQTERASIARELIADMVPMPPKAEREE